MFWKDESGTLTPATLIMLPALLMGAAMTLDLIYLNDHRSHVQAQADLSALEAVRHVNNENKAYRTAALSMAQNDLFPARRLDRERLTLGRYENGAFTPVADRRLRPNAAHVVAVSDAHMPVAGSLGRETKTVITREATAAVREKVSFSLSNCLLSLDLFHGALEPILGAHLDAICSDGALFLRTDALLETLSLDLDAPLTYGDVLDADVALSRVLSLALGTRIQAPDARIRLGDILHLGPESRGLAIGTRIPGSFITGSDLVFGSAELLTEHVLDLELRADLGPIADVPIALTVVEPRRIIADVEPGTPEAYAETAQIRLDVRGLDLLGLVSLDMSLRVAHAEATLTDRATTCQTSKGRPAAIFDPVQAGLMELHVGLSALGLTVQDDIALVQTAPEEIRFSRRDFERHASAVISPRLEGTLAEVDGTVLSLLDQLPLSGLTTGLAGGVLSPILGALSPVEELLAAVVHDFVGLAIAPAKLTPLGYDCRIALVQ